MFVPSNTLPFFRILELDSQFLDTDPETWIHNEVYLAAEEIVKSLTVINDSAERGVALIEEYNNLQTCDEEQKQHLLLTVSEHRKHYPNFNKSTLIASTPSE